MKKITLSIALFLQILVVWAQIPANYYNTTTGLSGTPLRSALHDIIDNHSSKSYSSLLTYYQTTDKKANGKVWDMYSDNPGGTPPYEFTFSQNCGNYSTEGDCWNREHSWPQSWFNSSSPMVSDLFHVYPTDGKVNGWRSNYPYGEVSNPTITTLNGGKLGPCSFPGYSGTVFEPIDEYKGDFARTYFYMCTRYYTEDSGWQTNDMITGANLKPWAVDLLKKWHQQDPVSAKEIARNNAVYGIQGNRNPYIDHPEFVCMIWSGVNYCAVVPSITNINTNPSTPGVNVGVFVSATVTDDGSITLVNLKWGTNSNALTNTHFMGGGANNVYTNTTAIPGQPNGTIIYYKIEATDNLSNVGSSSVLSYTVGTPPSPAPVITNINKTPNNPGPSDAVTIKATITDDVSVSSANVVWGTDGTTFPNTIVMNAGSNNLYTAISSIPAKTAGSTVYYKVNALDNLSQNTSSSVQQYVVSSGSSSVCAIDLLFSEYLEGSSNNKYLEIYNGTGQAVDLSDYKVNLYSNGSTTSTQELLLSGTLNNNEVYVIKNSAATLYNGTATVSNVTFFNGDDAIALSKISTGQYVDILGKIGEDPGTSWAVGNINMLNHTLIRKPNVLQGVSSNPSAGFPTLATEWIVDSIDVATYLGSHTMNCPTANTTISTNPFLDNTLCKGSFINVVFQVDGSINSGNTYTAELSDANGSFSNAISIGTLNSTNLMDVIPATIPTNSIAGNGYRIRVKASDPQAIGSDNGSNITIKDLPTINAGNDITICKGSAAVLSATGGVIYSWDQGAGDSSVVTVMPTETTVYSVSGIDSNGCSNTDTVIVYVRSVNKPSINLVGLYTIQSSSSTGNQWYKNDEILQGETEQELNVELSGTGNYYTIVTDSVGCISDSSNNMFIVVSGISKELHSTLSIYPNPNNGDFYIDVKSITNGDYTLEIFNSIGQLVKSNTFNTSSENKVNIPEAKGIYTIRLRNETSVYTGIVVLQ